MKILIVEDVSSSRLLMVKLVKDLWPEATVESCASGIKALSLLDPKKCCDLIFLDLGLPDIGGFQILELLKAQSPLTKIVTVSDEGSQEVLAESLKCGAVAYVTKPIMLNQMRALLSLSFAPEISANTSKNLLVVDDEKINRFLLRKIVELEGYNVIEATNGLEAVEAVHRHVFEAILMV